MSCLPVNVQKVTLLDLILKIRVFYLFIFSDIPLTHMLEKEIAIHSSTVAWKELTEEPGGLQFMG